MKTLSLFFLLLFQAYFPQDLGAIRKEFILASKDRESASALMDQLSTITEADKKVLVAYKGAVMALMAKYTKENQERKRLFREGVQLLEYAVSEAPDNIEIRCLRLSIQENTPKFLKYRSNIGDDKSFILTNYKNTPSLAVKDFVRSYIMQSDGFNTGEKQGL
ncbi:MAG TPA: hypothetical protein VLZ54_09280 [Arenibacter sp.]|nr:hypothetical protein [Arenibacter sp.]